MNSRDLRGQRFLVRQSTLGQRIPTYNKIQLQDELKVSRILFNETEFKFQEAYEEDLWVQTYINSITCNIIDALLQAR